ncbi:hypothetical protein JGU71_00490 [Antrihabitans sp. YC3-6]|uniref:Uncharacterized protein n=1 Tax=Antrihabitans stalagmiti TaxID=2799499 RepID=A0A934TZN9_9NOCA|nr:DUF6544 family protein [Antrihabitans stalagmiti]MBJ8337349.1 hypothetical protein [Antrihabitans stalagmiti]
MSTQQGSRPHTFADWQVRLSGDAVAEAFSDTELEGLPDPVRRYFHAAIATGTLLGTCVTLRMRGDIKVGGWLPFRARQVIDPSRGFVWMARAAGIISGSDEYLDGVGGMDWKLGGLFTVVHSEGDDVSKSAAGRGGAEGIWLPTAMLPRFGVTWSAIDDNHIVASRILGSTPIDLELTIDDAGRMTSLVFDRWGDPDQTGSWDWHRFGGEITGHRTFGGLTIPSAGRMGWHFGTSRWDAGEFFRYEITELER